MITSRFYCIFFLLGLIALNASAQKIKDKERDALALQYAQDSFDEFYELLRLPNDASNVDAMEKKHTLVRNCI